MLPAITCKYIYAASVEWLLEAKVKPIEALF